MKEGMPEVCGERTAEWGLVGERNPGAKLLGGELATQRSTSGLMAVVMGLVGRGPVALGGGVPTRGIGVLSAGAVGVELVELSEALGWGLLAVLLPGEEAVAVLLSEELPLPSFVAAAAFSAFLHLALLFWNQTWKDRQATGVTQVATPQLPAHSTCGATTMKAECRKYQTSECAGLWPVYNSSPPLSPLFPYHLSLSLSPPPPPLSPSLTHSLGLFLTCTLASVRLIFIASSSLMNTSG